MKLALCQLSYSCRFRLRKDGPVLRFKFPLAQAVSVGAAPVQDSNAEMELVAGCSAPGGVQSPQWHTSEQALYAVAPGSGDVMRLQARDGEDAGSARGPEWHVMLNTGGSPVAVGFDARGVMYLADLAHRAVLFVQNDGNTELAELVREWEGSSLLGPSALAFDASGTLFFTDSGPLGTTTLAKPHGSVFSISAETGIVTPLTFRSLAHPSALAVSPDGSSVYVAETMANRVLRFAQQPRGVWHCSVWRQFTGRMGPTALSVCEDGTLLVGLSDFSSVANASGVIAVLDATTAETVRELPVPGSGVSGVALGDTAIYVTDRASGDLYRASEPVDAVLRGSTPSTFRGSVGSKLAAA